MMRDELNDEQTVKKAIKEILHNGMIFVPCKSCGETWFVPGNAIGSAFICNKCIIQKQQEEYRNDKRRNICGR